VTGISEIPVATGPETEYDELPDDVEQLKAMLLAERARAARLEHILKLINRIDLRQAFWRSCPLISLHWRWKTRPSPRRGPGLQDKTDEETERYGLRPRRRRSPMGNVPASGHLPRFEVVIEPDNLECACGCALHKIGEDRSERLDIIPAQHRVVVTIRPRYGCRACSDGVTQAPAPAHVVSGGLPTEALIADVLINKFCDHLPLYRQSKIRPAGHRHQPCHVGELGWPGHRGTGCRSPTGCVRMPLPDRGCSSTKPRSRCWRREPARPRPATCGSSSVTTGPIGGADPAAGAHTYMPGRGAMWAKQLLGTYQGILQVDAWQAYDQFGKEEGASVGARNPTAGPICAVSLSTRAAMP
jgi:transposase